MVYGTKKERRVDIIIIPPWYKTSWFYAALVLIAILIIIVVISYIRRLREEISERKKVAKELQLSEARFRMIYEYAPVMIDAFDENGCCVLWNNECQKTFGWTMEELNVHDDSLALFYPDPEIRKKVIKTVTSNPEKVFREWHPLAKDGTEHICLWVNFKLSDGIVINLGYDITERRKAEQEISDLNKNLEQKVIERTRRVNAVNEELEAFNYAVSHDLKGPLRGINGFSQMLEKRCYDLLDDESKDYLGRIQKASGHMGSIVDSLLAISKITRKPIDLQNIDLSDIASQVADGLKASEPERDVEIIIQPDLSAYADGNLVAIIFENLLNNAWKFTKNEKTARIEVGSKKEDGAAVFFVKDNGTGFNMEYSDKLFQIFERLHKVDEYPGMGIGLVTVRRIITLHNGKIWAKSEEGKGATFYFTFSEN